MELTQLEINWFNKGALGCHRSINYWLFSRYRVHLDFLEIFIVILLSDLVFNEGTILILGKLILKSSSAYRLKIYNLSS